VAIERILEEIKKLPKLEREKLRRILEKESPVNESKRMFEKAEGSWYDIDAENLTEDIYNNRSNNGGRTDNEW